MQNQIPKGWQKVKLGDVAVVNMGQSPSSKFYNSEGDGLPFYQGVTDFGEKYPTPNVYCSQPIKTADPGSALFSVRAPVGEVNITTELSCIGRGTASISMMNGNNNYLYFLLKNYSGYFKAISSGTTYESINKEQIENVEIPIPQDPNEQIRIEKFLSAFDDKIEVNNKIAKTLEQMAQAIFKEWFIKSEKLKVKSEKLEKIAKIIKGKKPQKIYNGSRGRDIEYLLIESFTTNKRFFANENEVPQSDDGDIIVVMDGASSGRIFRGRRGVVGSTLAVIKPKPGISHEFLLLVLKKAEPQLMDNLTGSAIPHLDKDFLKSYSVSVPTPEVMEKFTHIVRSMLQKIVKIENENQKLAVLRDLLLPKLMKGEIRVKSE